MSAPTTPPPLNLPDHLIAAADRALRAVFAPATASRPLPASTQSAATALTEAQRQQAAGLMRVNHAGEIAAQGLYHGQALAARNPQVRDMLLAAGREETDHLAWCQTRLAELGDRPSRLDPLWYAGSLTLGLVAGLISDKASLGFVSETERQVERHLDGHLQALPEADTRSRAILEQMRSDEIQHGQQARDAGGIELPTPIKKLMQLTSRVMTRTAVYF
jgi:ubiquinone biosynthesis monooxygenase Coq7